MIKYAFVNTTWGMRLGSFVYGYLFVVTQNLGRLLYTKQTMLLIENVSLI